MHLGFTKKTLSRIEFKIEELILLTIIVLNVLDAIELLPPDLDFIKKVISWSALGYLLYKSRPSKILFGHPSELIFGKKKSGFDITIIVAFFFMIIKNLISYASSVVDVANVKGIALSHILEPLYTYLIANTAMIEITGLFIGSFLLLSVAIRFTLKVPIRKPSVMSIIHKNGAIPQTFLPFLWRTTTTFLVLLGFFIIIFNLVMEWLAVAIDAPLLMIGLATYIFFIVRHKEKFSAGSFLSRFGDFGSNFYQDVIKHFMYKKTVFRAVSGMLVLHVLTDALNFIWPFVFHGKDSYYAAILNLPHHLSAITIFGMDGVGMALSSKFLLGVALLGNTVGMLFLLLFPGLLWYLIYKNKPFHPTRGFLGIIFFSLITLVLTPVFSLRPLRNISFGGVDIMSRSIVDNALVPLEWGVFIAIACSLVVIMLSSRLRIEKFLMQTLIHLSQLFFTIYIAIFSFSVANNLLMIIGVLGRAERGLLTCIFLFFLIINVIFYIFGLFGFLSDTEAHIKEHVRY